MFKGLKEVAKAMIPQPMLLARQVRRALLGSSDLEVGLLPLLARSGSFVDVGANLGSWTGPAARAFKQVHAFEPYAELAAALRAAVPPNVTVHELALSDREGTARFAVPLQRGEPMTTRASLEANANVGFDEVVREVQMASLDSLGLCGIDVIKIDVEGHEESTLDGAWATIDRERPTLVIEIEERHHAGRSEAIIQRIVARGYGCCYLHANKVQRFEPGSIGRLQPADLAPLQGGKPAAYINNFIFIPNERATEVQVIERHLAAAAA